MREFHFYINLQQAFFLARQYAKRISSCTFLFTSVPKDCLNEDYIRSLFNSVKNVWIAGDTKQLDKIIQERDNVERKYEFQTGHEAEQVSTSTSYPEYGKRPTHRTGPSGLIGENVDTIGWCRKKLKDLIPKAQSAQYDWLTGDYEKHTTFFVELSTQYDTQIAFQTATHQRPLQLSSRFIGIKPNEVIWKNLRYPWWQVAIRRYVIYTAITVLIVSWALPVIVVGIIAHVNTIKSRPGSTWIQNIPQAILCAVSGLLPSIALSILMSSVPVFMRTCARWSGCVSASQAELFTQNAYFIFHLQSPSIPTASNFYISVFIIQGLTIATGVLTQIFGFVMFTLSYRFTNMTPRIIYDKVTALGAIYFGSLMPIYTNMAVISIIYSIIAPFLLLWSPISMGLLYLARRYNVLYVTATGVDTGGLIYPRALKLACVIGQRIRNKPRI
ncbi:hypothetical protein FPRO04_14443 [Fusarium proliferatum]|nr:hypothetical protein FPRO04_14443 [Fusarium proliferatum]